MINALLVRWAGGWFDVEDPSAYSGPEREEGFFKAGDSQYLEDATELAEAVLAHTAARNEEIDVTVEGPLTAVVGDTLTAPDSTGAAATWRVVAVTYSHDKEGNVVRSPELEIVA